MGEGRSWNFKIPTPRLSLGIASGVCTKNFSPAAFYSAELLNNL